MKKGTKRRLARAFSRAVNHESIDSKTDTPDHAIGLYLVKCLEVFIRESQAHALRRSKHV